MATLDIQSIKRKSVAGVLSYMGRTMALQVVAVIANGLLGLYLSPAEFGVYFVVTAVIGMFTFLSDIGLAAALVQKKAEPTVAELRTTFTVQQLLALVILGLSFALTPVWRQYSGLDQRGLYLLYALSFSFLMASFKTIPSILLERQLEFRKKVIPEMVEQVLFYGLVVYFAREGWGLTSYTIAVLCRSIAGVIVMYCIQSWPIGLAITREALKQLLSFGVKFQLNDLIARLKDDLYVVVLGLFLSKTEMGYVSWAKKWSLFPYQQSVTNVIAVTFPTYSRLQHEHEKLGRAVEKSMFFITLFILPVLGGMAVMAWPLTQVIPGYAKWQPALVSLAFFCLNVAWAAMSSPLTNTLNAIGKINQTLKLMVLWTSLTWLLTPPALMWFGYTGVAIVSAVVASTSAITIRMVKRVVPFTFLPQVWRQTVAAGVMVTVLGLGQAFWGQSWLWFGAGVGVGAVVYGVVMALLGWRMVQKEVLSLLAK